MIKNSVHHLLKMSCLFVVVLQIGIVLSLRFGLGWLILAMFGRRVILYLPELYYPFITKLFGPEIAEAERSRRAGSDKAWLSKAFGFIYLALIIIVFWKFNVPLLEIGQ